ncbi:MAG TPA: MFS transporter, partial [Ignavibacteria bacterium]|nr:MFS transporter [Ignavibacteria bacterium]
MEYNRFYKILIIVITTLASFNAGFMSSALNIALPVIGRELNISAISLSWISTSFLLATAVTLLPFGKLSDIFGRAKFFKIGAFLFAVSSLLCAISPNVSMIIFSRAVQGISASLISVTSITILVSIFPISSRGKVIGINTTGV